GAAAAPRRRRRARAGPASALLKAQEQINAREPDVEALQPQQRARAREPAYGTVSVRLVSKQAPPPARPVKLASGFTGGLAAGWHALQRGASGVLAGLGAPLPVVLVVIIAGFAALRGRRGLARGRAGGGPARPRPAD